MGFQRETASRGSLAMYTSVCLSVFVVSRETSQLFSKVVFAGVLEFIVFRTTPTPLSIVGAIIIMTSAIYTSVLSSSFTSTQLMFISLIADQKGCFQANC